jgi:4-hydroxyphenylpyruvate dioxygenase
MLPALAQVCSLPSPFEQDLADYAAGQCRQVELWLGKLETYLGTHAAADAQRLLAEHELSAPVASYQGGLLVTQGEARKEHWAHFARRLPLLAALGVKTLVVAGDIADPLTQPDYERLKFSLHQAAQQAAPHGVRIALEFQAGATFANNLQTAASLIAEIGEANLGLCLDLFHYYIGPSKPEDLYLLSRDNLFHVQVCDLAGIPRELAKDADRILPGEGDIPFADVLSRLREIEYDGCVSVELMNPQLWQVPPRQFGEIALTALRKALGLADNG